MRRTLPVTALGLAVLMSACSSGGGDSGNGGGARSTTGQVELLLVDAPNDDVKQVVVTIAKVDAHVAGGGDWVNLTAQEKTLDLLTLQGGTFASLGIGNLPAGRVTQLRLELKEAGPHYVVDAGDKVHPLVIPSGTIKINAGFDWPACATGKITIDFDGKKSIALHPAGGDAAADAWHMRPVVNLRSVDHDGGKCRGDGGSPGNGGGKPDDAGAGGNPGQDPGKGNGNGNGNGGGNGREKDGGGMPGDPGKGNGREKDGGGMPEDPGKGNGKEKDGGGMPEDPGKGNGKGNGKGTDAGAAACASVSCPMPMQFCLNGTCQNVMAP